MSAAGKNGSFAHKLSRLLLGPARDPLSKDAKHSIALVAFFAWIGLGADGLSSSAYGPEEAFLALGQNGELAIFLAIATAITIFIISFAYIQVMELFPAGGGGYRVASNLLGARAGLVSGSALIVDYVLTITISVAAGVDAIFSTLPPEWQSYKVMAAMVVIAIITWMNLRGIKESIKVLMPIFMGFVISHALIIFYGTALHWHGLANILPKATTHANEMADASGWLMVFAVMLKAFSLGGGTYTGLEAVSNSVHSLAEPKVKTGKWTMFYVAFSLAFMAAGIILLYLLWGAEKQPGETLNATVFGAILDNLTIAGTPVTPWLLPIILMFQTGILLVAANTGFLAGPSVLANMASDKWMPHFFASLSSQLVTRNGILLMSAASVITLLLTGGVVHVLVVLYSINVFLTFSLSLLGLSLHWFKTRPKGWVQRLCVSSLGLLVCFSILCITVVEKFFTGGWLTMIITSLVIATGYFIHRHYRKTQKKIDQASELFATRDIPKMANPPKLEPEKPTAAILVNESFGSGMHTLLWIRRMFPNCFENFVFLSVGEVDSQNFYEEGALSSMRRSSRKMLADYVNYCHAHHMPADSYLAYGTDVIEKLTELSEKVVKDFPRVVFFGAKLVFEDENMFTAILHNHTALLMQRRLHRRGHNMVILPMRV
ncbi:MAG: APC family permease [Alphaproteobacteria bacterium]